MRLVHGEEGKLRERIGKEEEGGVVGKEKIVGCEILTFSLFGDPRVYVLPGLLWSFGKGQLLQLRVIELKTGLLIGLWRENVQGNNNAK